MAEKVQCADFEVMAVLYAAGELEPEARAGVEEHARACHSCAATLENEMKLRDAILAGTEGEPAADASLLARCRHELYEALDDAPPRVQREGWREWLSPDRWLAEFRRALVFHPGWTAAALLLAGALGGSAVRAWYGASTFPLPGKPVMTVSAAPALSEKELESMGVEGIHWRMQGSGAPQVEVELLSKKPLVVQGTPEDAEVRRVLTYVVEHGQKFDPGLRLDSLEVLRTRAADPRVQAALCTAARHDSNPAVRLKALETLNGLGADPAVRQTLLAALSEDQNSGVRIEAINALLAAVGGTDLSSIRPMLPMAPEAIEILRDRERNDSNSYVRLRSARVLSRLTAYGDAGSPHP